MSETATLMHDNEFVARLTVLRSDIRVSHRSHWSALNPCYQALGQNGFADLPAFAASSKDMELLSRCDEMLGDIIDSVSNENIFTWIVRLIWPMVHSEGNETLQESANMVVETCRMAAHVILHWTDCSVFTNRVAYLFLAGEYGEACDLILPYSKIEFDVQSFADAAWEVRSSRKRREASLLGGHDGSAVAGGIGNVPVEDGESDTVCASDRIAGSADSPLARQYVFDVQRVERECRGLLRGGDAAALFADAAFVERYERIMSLMHSLAGASLVAPSIEGACFKGDAASLSQALDPLLEYGGIVGKSGLETLPLVVMSAVAEGSSVGAEWDSVTGSLGLLRDAGSDMAAVVLARVPDPVYARALAVALLAFDSDGYERIVADHGAVSPTSVGPTIH